MRRLLNGIVYCLAVLLAACVSVPPAQDIAIADVLVSPMTVVLDYETSDDGLIIFRLDLPGMESSKFILDTGATTSALYKQTLTGPNFIGQEGKLVRIHGMMETEMRPTIMLSGFKIGTSPIKNINAAILDKPNYDEPLLHQVKGVIGLDILSPFRLLIDPVQKKLFFIDKRTLPIVFGRVWKPIPLTEKPFDQEVYGLHFIELRVNGAPTFALLDTGAEFNVMNWNFRNLWQLTIKRRGLKKEWEHNGAIGEFKPQGLAIIRDMKTGGFSWPKQEFAVFDLTTFNSVGLETKPIMIAGAPFFEDKTILIDFERDVMWIKTTLSPEINAVR